MQLKMLYIQEGKEKTKTNKHSNKQKKRKKTDVLILKEQKQDRIFINDVRD